MHPIRRLQALNIRRIAPTHFGIFDDPEWQLRAVEQDLDETERWLEGVMRDDPDVEELRQAVRGLDARTKACGRG